MPETAHHNRKAAGFIAPDRLNWETMNPGPPLSSYFMSLQFVIFDGPDALKEHGVHWDRLLTEVAAVTEAPTFFLDRSWLEPWLSFKGKEQSFLFAALRNTETSEWHAGMPLCILETHSGGSKTRQLSAAGFPDSDCVFVPALNNQARRTLIHGLLEHWRQNLKKVVAFDIRELPKDGPSDKLFHEWAIAHGGAMIFQTVSRSPRLVLADFPGAGEQTPGKLGRNLRRRQRILAEAGQAEMKFQVIDSGEVDSFFQICREIEAQSWKGEDEVGVLCGADGEFTHEVWANLAAAGQLAIGLVTLDGATIAYHWGMIWHGVFLSYNLAQLPEAQKLSPGTLLLDYMIHNASELGISEFDASRGGLDHDHILAPYKGPVRFHRRAVIFRKSVLGRLMDWRLRRFIAERD